MSGADTMGCGDASNQMNRIFALKWVEANRERLLALKRNKIAWKTVTENISSCLRTTSPNCDWNAWISHVAGVMWASSYEQALDIDADAASGDCRLMFKRMARDLDRVGYERLLVHLDNLLKSEESVVGTPIAFAPVEIELSSNPLRGVW